MIKNKVIFILFVAIVITSFLGTGDSVYSQQVQFPKREIQMLVGFPAGGATDLVARAVADAMEKTLGKPVVVVNKPGAAGLLALNELVRSTPDGYKINMSSVTPLTAKYTVKDAPSLGDIQVIAMVNIDPGIILVKGDSHYKSLKELFNDAKAKPRTITFGHTGVGAFIHYMASVWQVISGARFKFVPYSGDAETLPALAGGHVDVTGCTIPPARELIKSGKIRILAIATEKRDPDFPDVPTFKEQGCNWAGGTFKFLAAPKGTPNEVLTKLEEAVDAAMKSDRLNTFWKTSGFAPFYMKRDQAAQYLKQEEKFVEQAFQIN